MKRFWPLIFIAGIILAAYLLRADTIYTPTQYASTITNVLLSASGTTTTNKVGSAFFVEAVSYHTIHGINGGSTLQQFAVDRSLDGQNWVVVGTNALLANGTTEVTMTGRWSYVRARQIGTNAAMSVLYLGGN